MVKKIFLTVDTECHDIQKINRYIIGDTPGGNYGLEKILRLGKELSVPVNVFLDIPECHSYGENYIKNLVSLIRQYGHSIYLHIHPDYIADPKRKHFWEYTKEEQKDIFRIAISDYIRLCGNQEKLFFRAGAWGVNSDTYEALSEIRPEFGLSEIVDLSYVYQSRRRCHLSYKEYGAANSCKIYKGIMVFPNTTYISFDYFGKQRTLGLSVPDTCFGEFKKIMNQNNLSNTVYAMHSWDFLKRWFFLPDKLLGDELRIRKFTKCIAYAKKRGYIFDDLENIEMFQEKDQCINLCKGLRGKITCLWYNYIRYAQIGRTYKKYAILYFCPIILCTILLLVFCICVL